MPVKNCHVMMESSVQSAWRAVAKWEAIIMARDGPHDSCGKMASNHQIFIIRYLQFVERKHLGTELQHWQVNFTLGCPQLVSQHF
jgi:hypothetical protein